MSNLPSRLSLPEGRSCAECVHLERCRRLQVTWPERRQCEFWPSRFRMGRAAEPAGESYYPRHASPGMHWGMP